jgi:hypothetical protein
MNALALVDCDMNIYNEKGESATPALPGQELGAGSWFASLVKEFVSRVGKDRPADYPPGPCFKMTDYLKAEPSLDLVQTRAVGIPINWEGPPDNDLENAEEVGSLMGESWPQSVQSWRPTCISLGISPEDFDFWQKGIEADFNTGRVKIYTKYHFWAAEVKA